MLFRSLFPRTTGDGFDPLSPGTIAADVTIGFMLELPRVARIVAQHAVDPTLPGLEEVIDRLIKATFDAPTANPYEAAVQRAEQRVLVSRLMGVAQASTNNDVRAIAAGRLNRIAARAGANGNSSSNRSPPRKFEFVTSHQQPARDLPIRRAVGVFGKFI